MIIKQEADKIGANYNGCDDNQDCIKARRDKQVEISNFDISQYLDDKKIIAEYLSQILEDVFKSN